VRKYMDALCVYFWACTPVLFSLATFSLFVAMGNQLRRRHREYSISTLLYYTLLYCAATPLYCTAQPCH